MLKRRVQGGGVQDNEKGIASTLSAFSELLLQETMAMTKFFGVEGIDFQYYIGQFEELRQLLWGQPIVLTDYD